jgi:hypothetical protein
MAITLDGTNGITTPALENDGVTTVAAGSASAPAITTDGDTNTGIFFPAADTIAFAEGGTEVMRLDSSANLQFNSGYGSVATAYGCRAWVNFNGTGTVAIRASGNVSSITDNGTGDYTVNFTNAMPNANYTTVLTAAGNRNATDQMLSNVATNGNANANNPELYSTTQVRIRSGNTTATFTNVDVTYFGVAIFR